MAMRAVVLSCGSSSRSCAEFAITLREAPKPKTQVSNKSQSSNFQKRERACSQHFEIWSFENSLELGIWVLDFRSHLSPLKSSSALVLVASKFSINFSIASIGGSAAMVLRNNC